MNFSLDPNNLKAIFFDVGNTLLLPNPSVEDVCIEILAKRGYRVDKDQVLKALVKADKAYEDQYWKDDRFWLSEIDAARFWSGLYELMLREVGLDGDAGEVSDEIYRAFGKGHRWQPYPDVVPAFIKLAARGYKMGLISNWDTRLATLMVEIGLSDYLDFVVSSASVGYLKPQPQIFEIALSRANVSPDEALHVGDHYYADVMGAKSVGITPVLIDRHSKIESSDCLLINDLNDLLAHLRIDH